MSAWKNMGDRNFILNGGILVRRHNSEEEIAEYPDLAGQYDAFVLAPADGCSNDSDNGEMIAGLAMIDVSDIYDPDSWIDKNALLSFSERSEEDMTDEEWVTAILEYYGLSNVMAQSMRLRYPVDDDDYVITRKEVASWLREIGAGEFAGKETAMDPEWWTEAYASLNRMVRDANETDGLSGAEKDAMDLIFKAHTAAGKLAKGN